MGMDVSLLNVVVKDYVFGTLKSSLPILWNLGKQYFARRKTMAKSQKPVSKVYCWKTFN